MRASLLTIVLVAASAFVAGCAGSDDPPGSTTTTTSTTATTTPEATATTTPETTPSSAPTTTAAPVTADPANYTDGVWSADGMTRNSGGALAFQTPTGNIVCLLAGDQGHVTCRVAEHTWEIPDDTSCEQDWMADEVTLDSGGVWLGSCQGGAEMPGRANVLEYGSRLSQDLLACTSTDAGVSCEHMRSGRGVTVSRTSIVIV
jgi:hypothetical protein